ncbi:MAG: NCS2 family permease [Oscillospiraceae bacterium]
MDKLFKLKEHNTNVRTEIIAGVTTFFAMAYIVFVNPATLGATGMDQTAVMIATCLSAAIGCFLTGFMANVPFAQAPGMGLNAYFTYGLCFGMGYTWQQSLAIVFVSGVLFLIVTLSPLRKIIIESIPAFLKSAISAGIGMFIAFIGLINAGIVKCFGPEGSNYTEMGNIVKGAPFLAIIGLLIIMVLMAYKVKGAIFIGIVATTLIGIPMGITSFPGGTFTDFSKLGEIFFQMDFGVFALPILPVITAVVSFFMVDMFDTVGTLIGAAGNAGMLDKDGNLPKGDRALIADAIATCTGAILGTSTVTTYIESAAGIEEGGRTGLTPIVVGILFIIACCFAPIAGIVPGAAAAPALIIVGILMMNNAAKINWSDFEQAAPAFITIAFMPFTYSIANGIGVGFISYCVIKLARGKAKEVKPVTFIIALLFIAKYILSGI